MIMNKFMKTAHLAVPAHLAASLSALSSFSWAQGMGLKGVEDWELKIENNNNNKDYMYVMLYFEWAFLLNKQYLKSASDRFEPE